MDGSSTSKDSHELTGFVTTLGRWVTIAEFSTKDEAEGALRSCHSKNQPAPKQASVNFDEFALFSIQPTEPKVEIRWKLDPPTYAPHDYGTSRYARV